jgi:hypothetical protein
LTSVSSPPISGFFEEKIYFVTMLFTMYTAKLVTMPVRASADPVIVRKLEDGPHRSESMVLIVDEFVGSSLHISGR